MPARTSRVARTPRAGPGARPRARVAADACGLTATPHAACGLRGTNSCNTPTSYSGMRAGRKGASSMSGGGGVTGGALVAVEVGAAAAGQPHHAGMGCGTTAPW